MTADTPLPAPRNTTHDWGVGVDVAHLEQIRAAPDTYAPGGPLHLVLEVMAHADDEAEALGVRGPCVVTLGDGWLSVADAGRGTDTRRDGAGAAVVKPVMATRDLRFFDHTAPPDLPDGHPRRGMSVVAALSTWLEHTQRRHDGAWARRYEHGVPVSDLVPVEPDGTTGTTVRFAPDPALCRPAGLAGSRLDLLQRFAHLDVVVTGLV